MKTMDGRAQKTIFRRPWGGHCAHRLETGCLPLPIHAFKHSRTVLASVSGL